MKQRTRRASVGVACVAWLSLAASSRADFVPTMVFTRQFSIATSEGSEGGHGDRRYTIANLFTGDPKATWVVDRKTQPDERGFKRYWHGHEGVEVWFPGAGQIDGIRLMNGFNKSARLYSLNDRVGEVEIWYRHKLLKRSKLSDALGWHSVTFAPIVMGSDIWNDGLQIRFTKIRPGTVHDLCLSGLELTSGDHVIPWPYKQTLFYHPGGADETELQLWGPAGSVIAKDRYNSYIGPGNLQQSRYFLGCDYTKRHLRIWIVDTKLSRVVHRKTMFPIKDPRDPFVSIDSVEWMALAPQRSVSFSRPCRGER